MPSDSSHQLRCKSSLKAILRKYPNGKVLLEIHCKDNYCTGKKPDIVVLHYFDVETGALVDTKKFRKPKSTRG